MRQRDEEGGQTDHHGEPYAVEQALDGDGGKDREKSPRKPPRYQIGPDQLAGTQWEQLVGEEPGVNRLRSAQKGKLPFPPEKQPPARSLNDVAQKVDRNRRDNPYPVNTSKSAVEFGWVDIVEDPDDAREREQ
jgi:hypothetical protein